jgi:hypothetical protein
MAGPSIDVAFSWFSPGQTPRLAIDLAGHARDRSLRAQEGTRKYIRKGRATTIRLSPGSSVFPN